MYITVGEEIKAVAFLCEDREVDGEKRHTPVATAFFVSLEDLNTRWTYVVTARHVVEDATSDILHLRVNKTTEGFRELGIQRDRWYRHDDADVAAVLFTPKPEEVADLEGARIPLTSCVGPAPDYQYSGPPYGVPVPVRMGQEVFYVGLFSQHYGEERNLPIARFGRISRMPTAVTLPRDRDTTRFKTVAYLAESLSWGGHSGSPVWCLFHSASHVIVQRTPAALFGYVPALLGLVSAHYDIPREARTTGDVLGKIEADLNAGIAAITPADAIRELLTREDLFEERRALKNAK